MRTTHEASSQKSAALVSWTEASRASLSSPELRPRSGRGQAETRAHEGEIRTRSGRGQGGTRTSSGRAHDELMGEIVRDRAELACGDA
jgi:hypothetical protein